MPGEALRLSRYPLYFCFERPVPVVERSTSGSGSDEGTSSACTTGLLDKLPCRAARRTLRFRFFLEQQSNFAARDVQFDHRREELHAHNGAWNLLHQWTCEREQRGP